MIFIQSILICLSSFNFQTIISYTISIFNIHKPNDTGYVNWYQCVWMCYVYDLNIWLGFFGWPAGPIIIIISFRASSRYNQKEEIEERGGTYHLAVWIANAAKEQRWEQNTTSQDRLAGKPQAHSSLILNQSSLFIFLFLY